MEIQINWMSISVIIAILGHAAFTIWATATTKTTLMIKLDSVVESLQKVDKELEKRDHKIEAAWKRIDEINRRLYIVEANNSGA